MIRPRRAVTETAPYSLPEGSRAGKIRLDLNENNWGCSPRVVETLRRLDPSAISIYPEYDALVGQLATQLGVGRENILLTNGADDAIRCLADVYLEQGDQVVVPVPTFPVYVQYCQLREADIQEVLFHDDLSYPVERILRAISAETRMVVLVNPNNPTGTCLTLEELKEILNAATGAVVILDEAYCHYAGVTHVGLVKRYPNLMVLRTFSKAYGLAGLRLGCVVSQPQNIDTLARVNPPFAINAVAVAAARGALEDEEWTERTVSEVKVERRFLRRELSALGIESPATETNFVLARAGLWAELVWEQLADEGILVKQLRDYPLLVDYLRITVGRRDENSTLLETLREILRSRALLFDMDGVLVDVSESYLLAIQRTAESFLHQEVGLADIQAYKNMGGFNNDWDLTAALVASRGQAVDRKEIVEVFQRHYLGESFDGLIQNEEWLLRRDVLEELGRRYVLGIVTGRPRVEAEYALARARVGDLFETVVAMEDVPDGREKPDPYGLELAIEKLGVSSAMYVGDTIDDVQAAIAASVIPVAVVSRGAEVREQRELLQAGGARVVLENVNDIVEVAL
jgi:histidinol-phosphate aminotransferase